MKQYETYKPSGIELLGEIPEHWDVKRVKDSVVSPLKYGANEAAEDDNPLNPRYIRITDFSDNGLLKEETFKSLPHSIAKDYLLNEDDILFARSGATVGKTFIFKNYNGKACFAGYLIKASLNKKIMTPSFLYFFSKSYSYDNWKNFINTESTIQNISAEKYNNLLLPFPPLSEQAAIANYLDTKTAVIDRKIELLTTKAAKYKALRRSLINETVCRGLNLNVSLKDSGVEWIGMIPEHWEVKRVKEIFRNTGSGTTPPSGDQTYYDDNGSNWLQTGDLNDSFITETSKKISQKAVAEFSTLKRYPKNSLVIAMYGATIGKMGYLNIDTTTNQACCVLTNPKGNNSQYLFYQLLSIKQFIISLSTGGGQPNINQDIVRFLRLCLPDLQEQTAIANYLDEKTTQIDTILSNIGEQITKLRQLRKTLINDVVTGKINVT
ncbi:MAG: restriction endonuclease subunit S [Paludibacter sp.]